MTSEYYWSILTLNYLESKILGKFRMLFAI